MVSHFATPESTDDLIDDRALASAEDDRLHHEHFVDELARVIRSAKTPSNVALYGPWGSGKSGIAALLTERFEKDPAVRFVRFDASKYAQTPLRRHFISQTAAELRRQQVDLDPDAFDSGLYIDQKRGSTDLSWRQGASALGLIVVAFGGFAALGVTLAGLYSHFAVGPAGEAFHQAVVYLLPRLLVAGPIVAAVAAFAVKRMSEHTLNAPSSEEQFERLFRQLVAQATRTAAPGRTVRMLDSGRRRALRLIGRAPIAIEAQKTRLVVFIDELDRCAPETVVNVLTTLWTFFDVDSCVFVVAADQQVLEEALTRASQQATPLDAINPYYTAGSAYLDKVFQLQMSLPPLKAQRLSTFAREIVVGRGGLWGELREGNQLDDVISTLIPSHVQSPRRVKALLNQFALSYRIAQRRVAAGMLGALDGRVAQLAKLACLRVEFPLFAAELVREPRLASWVTGELDRATLGDGEPGSRIPAYVSDDVRERIIKWADGQLPPDRLIHRRAGSADAGEPDADSTGVEEVHAEQLLEYLRRTRTITGPSADLIFLDTAGADLGVDATFASELEIAAVDGNRHRVGQLIGGLPEDERPAALKLMARIARHTAFGLEAENAAGSLLEAVAAAGDAFAPAADEIAAALADDRYRLADDDLTGALAVALASEHPNATVLRRKVLDDERLLADHRLCQDVVRAATQLTDDRDRVAEAFAELLTTADDAAGAIVDLPDGVARHIADAAADPLARRLNVLEDVEPLGHEVDALLDGQPDVAVAVFTAFLQAEDAPIAAELQDLVDTRVEQLAPVSDPALGRQMLAHASSRDVDRAIVWAAALAPDLIASDEISGCTAALSPILVALWQQTNPTDRPGAIAAALQRLAAYLSAGRIDPTDDLDQTVVSSFGRLGDDASRQAASADLDAADALTDAGLLDSRLPADSVIEQVCATLARQAIGVSEQDADEVYRLADRVIERASEPVVGRLADITSSYWPATAANLRVRAGLLQETESPMSSAEAANFASAHMPAFRFGLATLIAGWDWTVDDLVLLLGPVVAVDLPREVGDAVRETSATWEDDHSDRRDELAGKLVAEAAHAAPSVALLRAIDIGQVPAPVLAHALRQATDDATTSEQHDQVLTTWGRLRQLHPGLDRHASDLIAHVFVPIVDDADRISLDVICNHLALLDTPLATDRERGRRRLRKAAERLGTTEETEQRLIDAGLARRRKLRGGTVDT